MFNFKCVSDRNVLSFTDCSQQAVLQPVSTTTSLSSHNISSDGSEVDWFPNSTQPGVADDLNNNYPKWLQIDLGEKRRITGNTCNLHNLISLTYLFIQIFHLWAPDCASFLFNTSSFGFPNASFSSFSILQGEMECYYIKPNSQTCRKDPQLVPEGVIILTKGLPRDQL